MTPGSQPEVELWTKLVKLHNLTKAHILFCEELDDTFRTFIQPRNEWCNAFEHLMRAKASELGLKSGGPDHAYIRENLSAAVGHEYRAFFDMADWLSLKLRQRIREELNPYSKDAIKAVLPDYYDRVRPRLESFVHEIAAIREAKDIGLNEGLLAEVERYNLVLEELKAFVQRLSSVKPALEEFREKEERALNRTQRWDVFKLIVVPLATLAAGYWLGRIF